MRIAGSFLAFTVILPMALPLAGQAPSILEPKLERRQGPPLWISAEAVADAEEIIKLDRIDDFHLRKSVEAQRSSLGNRPDFHPSKSGEKPVVATIPLSECKSDTLSAELRGGEGPSATLADLAKYSKSILRGRIRSMEPGFASGEPALLMGMEASEAIKGSAPSALLYINYPVARFRIGPLLFCNAEKGFEPRPGDEVLLFDYTGPIDRDHVLYAPRLDQLFFQSQDGHLFLPPRLKETPALRSVQILDEVTDQLRRSGTPIDSRQGGPTGTTTEPPSRKSCRLFIRQASRGSISTTGGAGASTATATCSRSSAQPGGEALTESCGLS